MWKMTSGLVAVVLVTAAMAVEQPASDEDPWLPSLQNPRPSRSVHTRDWVAQAWHPDSSKSLPPTSHQRWSSDDEDRDGMAWDPEALGAEIRFNSPGSLDDLGNSEEAILDFERQQESPWLAKRQPPRRLGSLVDLYKDVAHGLSPFVANPENQFLPAKPERRSGRRPAACRFGPFGLVCWNSARRGAVMRQRSAQYAQ